MIARTVFITGLWYAQAAQAKKEKEAIKKALRKERKTFRAACKVGWVISGMGGGSIGGCDWVQSLCGRSTATLRGMSRSW